MRVGRVARGRGAASRGRACWVGIAMAARRKRAAGPRYHTGFRRRTLARAMSAPHPAVLDYPFATPPAPGTALAVAPRIWWLRMPLPFALDHINLWLLEEGDGWTLVDTRLRRCDHARAVGAPLRADAGRPPDHAHHRHALPSRPPGQRRLARASASAAAVHDDPGRIPHRARDHRRARRRTRPRDTCALFARHGMADGGRGRAGRARQPLPARACPRRPRRSTACIDGDEIAAGGTRGASSRATATPPSTRRCSRRRQRRADLRRHAAAEDQHQRERLAVRSRRRSARPVPRLARRASTTCRRHARAALARAAVPRHRAARRAAACASRRAPRRAARGRRRRAGAGVRGGHGRRCCSAASSTCSSAFSPWARRSPTSITCGGKAA